MNSLKNWLVKLLWRLKSFRYPYIFSLNLKDIQAKFIVNSPVEEFRTKGWGGEKEYTRYLIENLKAGETFFDIGASVGFISILIALKLGKGKVFAFEPDPAIADRLSKNIKLNSLDNLISVPIALSDKKGKVKLYSEGSDNYSPSMESVQGFEKYVMVKSDTVDHLINLGVIDTPNSVKIDVEGAEEMVLAGMNKLLMSSKKPKNIFIEVHKNFLPKFGSSSNEVLALLKTKGYKVKKSINRANQCLYHFVYRSV